MCVFYWRKGASIVATRFLIDDTFSGTGLDFSLSDLFFFLETITLQPQRFALIPVGSTKKMYP